MKALLIQGFCCWALASTVGLAKANDRIPPQSWSHVNIRGSNEWLNLQALVSASNDYIKKQRPKFLPKKFLITASIYPEEPKHFVRLEYFEAFGRPLFQTSLDREGKVISFTEKIASEVTR